MLKYEGFKCGDRIRAYDFEPCPGRSEKYLEGVIKTVAPRGSEDRPYGFYRVQVEVDTLYPETPRQEVVVPMQSLFDYDGRVTKIESTLNIRGMI